MKLFNKIAYHSTKQKGLKKFDETTGNKAYTGEGAMAHGHGLYLQADKELNLKRYNEDMSQPYIEIDVGNGFHDWSWYHNEKKSLGYYGEDQELRMVYVAVDRLFYRVREDYDEVFKDDVSFTEYVKSLIEQDEDDFGRLKNIFKGARIVRPDISQYEVEIPDNFVFIEEDELVGNFEFDDKLIDIRYQIWNDLFDYVNMENNVDLIDEQFSDYGFNAYEYEDLLNRIFEYCRTSMMNKVPDTEIISEITSMIQDNVDLDDYEDEPEFVDELVDMFCGWFGILNKDISSMTGKVYYNILCRGSHNDSWLNSNLPSESEVSDILYQNGINGIHYDGGTDGECWVIFNCKDLQIVKEN